MTLINGTSFFPHLFTYRLNSLPPYKHHPVPTIMQITQVKPTPHQKHILHCEGKLFLWGCCWKLLLFLVQGWSLCCYVCILPTYLWVIISVIRFPIPRLEHATRISNGQQELQSAIGRQWDEAMVPSIPVHRRCCAGCAAVQAPGQKDAVSRSRTSAGAPTTMKIWTDPPPQGHFVSRREQEHPDGVSLVSRIGHLC